MQFGEFDVDIYAEYTMMVGFYLDKEGAEELMYDEFRFQSSMNVRAENDIVHMDLLENKVMIGKAGQKDKPLRNTMNLTVNEYREFLSDFSLTAAEFRKWLDDVVLRGDRVKFPYGMSEFETTLRFWKKQLHVMIDVKADAEQFLEEEWWHDIYH